MTSGSASSQPAPLYQRASFWLGNGLVILVSMALFWRQHAFVDRYAINLMFWDQWDFYQPLFDGKGWWATFAQQHGPHRQGAGFLITRVLAGLSGWNSRWDAFAVSFCLLGAAGLGFAVARRCGLRSGISLLAIPLIFFNIRQYEMFVGASNISHGAMPVLLFMTWALAWFIASPAWRVLALALLNFLLTFTGFGVFVGLITPLVLIVETIQSLIARNSRGALLSAAAVVAVGLSWFLFSRGYHFNPAVEGFHFPHERPIEYLYFIGLMFANFFGVPGYGAGAIATGVVVTVVLVILCASHGWRLLRQGVTNNRSSVVIFSFALYALIYCANTAVGRVVLGLEQAPTASRYVTLLIPAALAILLHLGSVKETAKARWLAFSYALLLIPGTLILRANDIQSVNWYSNGRRAWKSSYLAHHDLQRAEKDASFPAYPSPIIAGRLQFLEKHRLNLFNPAGQP